MSKRGSLEFLLDEAFKEKRKNILCILEEKLEKMGVDKMKEYLETSIESDSNTLKYKGQWLSDYDSLKIDIRIETAKAFLRDVLCT